MPLRPCLGCGRPTDAGRCAACRSALNRERDQRRGTSTERGYDADHQAERSAWAPLVDAGQIYCRRYPSGQCQAPHPLIQPGEEWHLGHPDQQCPAPKAPEHARCNSTAPHRKIRD